VSDVPAERAVFISYVREDGGRVDRLESALRAASIPVWRDTNELWPGQDWRLRIRRAIEQDALAFVACFSENSLNREASYQNEELYLAAEQMRLRSQGAVWLIPVRFDDCELPHLDLGAGRTLASLNWVDLFNQNWDAGLARLLVSVVNILGLAATRAEVPSSGSVASIVASVRRDVTEGGRAVATHDALRREVDRLRELPALQADARGESANQVDSVETFEREVEPLVAIVATAAYWGDAAIDRWWVEDVVRLSERPLVSGSLAVIDRPRLPAVAMGWAAAVAAISADRLDLLTRLLALGPIQDPGRNDQVPALLALNAGLLHVSDDVARLYRLLRPTFVEHLGLGKQRYGESFERWLFLRVVACHCLRLRGVILPSEMLGIRVDGFRPVAAVPKTWLLAQLERHGAAHPLIASGTWTGSPMDLGAVIEGVAASVGEMAEREDWRLIPPGRGGSLPTGRHYPASFSEDPDEYFGWSGASTST
jgi:hypothetical protein